MTIEEQVSREKFEERISGSPYWRDVTRWTNDADVAWQGSYVDEQTYFAWDIWQDAIASQTQTPTTEAESQQSGDYDGGEHIADAGKMVERIAELERDVERYEDAMHKLRSLCQAYPLDVFPEPDFKVAEEALAARGISLAAVSAANMRHVVQRVQKIIAPMTKQ